MTEGEFERICSVFESVRNSGFTYREIKSEDLVLVKREEEEEEEESGSKCGEVSDSEMEDFS